MSGINYSEKIPNNVDLHLNKRLQRALEHWQPAYIQWWRDMGPQGFQEYHQVYVRTAVSVEFALTGLVETLARHTRLRRPLGVFGSRRRRWGLHPRLGTLLRLAGLCRLRLARTNRVLLATPEANAGEAPEQAQRTAVLFLGRGATRLDLPLGNGREVLDLGHAARRRFGHGRALRRERRDDRKQACVDHHRL